MIPKPPPVTVGADALKKSKTPPEGEPKARDFAGRPAPKQPPCGQAAATDRVSTRR